MRPLRSCLSPAPAALTPSATAQMAASWDVAALFGAARVMSDEQRAKHNIKTAETGGDSIMDYGLDLWGPNINMFRRARPP